MGEERCELGLLLGGHVEDDSKGDFVRAKGSAALKKERLIVFDSVEGKLLLRVLELNTILRGKQRKRTDQRERRAEKKKKKERQRGQKIRIQSRATSLDRDDAGRESKREPERG